MGFPLGMNPPEELMAMAGGHGHRPWPKAMALGHGRRPWPWAMAEGHGLRPWPKAMAVRIEISLN